MAAVYQMQQRYFILSIVAFKIPKVTTRSFKGHTLTKMLEYSASFAYTYIDKFCIYIKSFVLYNLILD